MFRATPFVLALAARALYGQVDVLTAQYDATRTSSNMQEQILTGANVNVSQFGKLFTRTVDAPFYASPLIVTNLNIPAVGTRDVVFVATLGNTVYAFDADDPNASAPYWSLNLGTPLYRGCCYLGPTIGILSTPVIDRSTNTIYLTSIIQNNTDTGLYLYALDLGTGALKFNAPQRITYTSPSETLTNASLPGGASWLQRAGLLLVNGVLYVGTSAVWEGDTIFTQDGFIQAFQANDLSVRLASFDTDPTGEGGGFWQAGRGIAADSSGNVFAAINSGAYNPPTSFGSSVVKFSPGTLTVADWFTPADWSYLYNNNLDVSADGVTLMPGTSLAFAGGKIGVIYLLNQTNLGGLEPGSGNTPLQQFQASQGCGTAQCGQHLPTAYWPNATNPYLYVWDLYDYLRAYPFDPVAQRFQPANGTAGTLLPSRAGGIAISSNGSTGGTGIVWADTAAQDPYSTAVAGTLRAYNANNITQELYDSDQNSCRDAMGTFVKMSTPIVANGKVYVNTQSNVLPVYGLLSSLPPISPPAGTVHVTVGASIAGPTIMVDGGAPCTGPAGFDWVPGSQHTIATASPQTGLPGTSPQAGTPGTQFVWTGWSDGGNISHTVAPSTATAYTANFAIQYLLTGNVSPVAGGSIAASPSSATGYYSGGAAVQLTATPVAGCTFVNWSGALSGSTNPQTINMSAPQTVLANFQCSASAPGSFVTSYAHKLLRNDFSGWVGMQFTVGGNALSVSALGRILVYGNAATHQVKLVNGSNGSDVPGGSVSISTPGGAAGSFKYVSLAGPVTLQANTTYYLVSQEVSAGDQWYDFGGVSTTNAAVVSNAIYSSDSTSWLTMSTANTSYGPVSFLYTVGAPAQYLLSTSISPLAGGAIAAIPSALAGGYYTAGTAVQLTATPAAGCSFVDWTGALTGSANPQTVTMSGQQAVTANFQCAGPQPVSFLTGYALNAPSLRHDFSGWAGMKLTVGANPLTVSSLGRICVANNVQSHTLKFVNASDGTDVPGAAVSVNMAGCTPGQFLYGALSSLTLTAGTSYYLVSQEVYAGDQWYDQGTVSTTSVAAVNSSVYSSGGGWIPTGSANTSYVPVNFQYAAAASTQYLLTTGVLPAGSGSIAANPSAAGGSYNSGTSVQLTASPASGCTFVNWTGALTGTVNPQSVTMSAPQSVTANFQCAGPSGTPFLTGYALSGPALRNDFSGWVGMKFTVGSSPLAVSGLGRICVANNTASHTVKLVNAGSGTDVSGASAPVNMAGCSSGQFVYGAISPVTLPSGASFYLVSQETQGGDRWYDQGTVSATTAAVVNSSVYSSAGNWIPTGAGNTSYVPPNFQYTVVTPVPITVTVGTTPAGLSFTVDGSTYTATQTFSWTASSSHTIATSSPQSTGTGIQNVWSGWSDGGAISHTLTPAGGATYTAAFATQYLLTSSVSPASGGSIAAVPSAPAGYYSSGASVQLTANPASGCTFVNWTGALTGTVNPQSVTMSAAQTVTANFQCAAPPPSGCTPAALSLAQQQLTKTIGYLSTSQYASATNPNNSNRWIAGAATDWTSGFFPGWIWYMYEQTLDSSLLARAQAQTANLIGETTDASTHDVGFRILGSYGNGYRITGDPSYMSAIQTAAQTLATLYQPSAGVINSWPTYSSRINVIIDNMMNLELLFYAAQNGGNPNWTAMAVSHALKTMQNNVRPDGSTIQGVEYNPDGSVYSTFTADGYSVGSTWSRGQAWGLYGFTMAYRYTQDSRFLATAQQLANYFIQNLPSDFVPYWDFSQTAPAPRDSSAAAIAAAGLLELSTYVADPYKTTYYNAAMNIQASLSSASYLGNPANTDGILLHGTYSVPANASIDTSLIWGDYYFIQGCYRAMSPPPAPTNVAAASLVPGQINLTWNAQSGAVRYSVKRSVTSGGPYTNLAPPPVLTTNSFADTTVAANVTYYYVVSAISTAGESSNSSEVNASFTTQSLLLTSIISPAGGGSVVANPSAAGGYYVTGTSVQLTASPASGCTFVNWTGALTGTVNPQSLTMSAPQTVTANFQCAGPPPTGFVTAYALSGPALRNDFTGWVGMKFTVGSSPLAVSALGRICVANNTASHTVKLVNAGNGTDLSGASVAVNMAGCTAGQFAYGAIGTVTLPAGATFYLVSQETQGGDRWYDQGSILATNAAVVNSSVYFYGGNWMPIGAGNTSYVPPNFQYTVVTPVPITVTAGTSPAGLSFTVDGSTYTATQVFNWTSGSSHTIAAPSPQSAGTGIQNVWSAWSDGGAISHSVTPASGATYTASFTTQYLLTSSVSPMGSGSIATVPSAEGGYYSSATPVQLTATPASGCTFVNWAGALTGTVNPQSITISAPQTVTAAFQCSGPQPTGFLTGYALSAPALRNDFSGWVGMKFTVGASPLAVSSLGRICVTNNAASHTVKLVNPGNGTDVSGASAVVSMAGCTPGQFVYGAVSSLTLPAGSAYYLVSQEAQGGDQWYDEGTVSSTNDAVVNSSVYSYAGNWFPIGSGNTSYVPPNLQYSVITAPQYLLTASVSPAGGGSIAASPSSSGNTYPSGTAVQLTAIPASGCTFVNWTGALTGVANPQSLTMSAPQAVTANFQCTSSPSTTFLTGYALSGPPLRNDFSGWVGMKLTVGANSLAVTSLGRICLANNALSHAVKLVNAATGSDVAGATVSVNMAGCTPGQFVYGTLSSLTLAAGTSYYLVSQETQGGDRWYDYGTVSSTNDALVNGSIYFYNANWIPMGASKTSYVPPNFQYTVVQNTAGN